MEAEGSDDLRSTLRAELAEESFVAGLVGNVDPPTPLSPSTKTWFFGGGFKTKTEPWDEVERCRRQRRELGGVVERRLEKCVDDCGRSLRDARGAPDLRRALRSVLGSCEAALAANRERRQCDDAQDTALERVKHDDEGPQLDVDAACARARAEGRAEALAAFSERERLREKCSLYKDRIAYLEKELAHHSTLDDVPLDDDDDVSDLRHRLDLAEKRLAAFSGTERHKKLLALETELEERGHIIAALRDALDNIRTTPVVAPPPNGHHNKVDHLPATPTTPSPLMSSVSAVSDPSAFDDSDDDRSPRPTPGPPPAFVVTDDDHDKNNNGKKEDHAPAETAVPTKQNGTPPVEKTVISREPNGHDVVIISPGTFVV